MHLAMKLKPLILIRSILFSNILYEIGQLLVSRKGTNPMNPFFLKLNKYFGIIKGKLFLNYFFFDIALNFILLQKNDSFYTILRPLSDIKVLVPGSGLGRLAWEFANCGFTCQGNDRSLYMLIPSYFVLNS